MRLSDLQTKYIVNVQDGKNIGNIIDVKIDEETGNIIYLIENNVNPDEEYTTMQYILDLKTMQLEYEI